MRRLAAPPPFKEFIVKSTALAGITVSPRWVSLVLLCAVTLLFCGCAGYQFAADSPSILGDGTKTLKIKEVDNPSLEAWLPHSIRSVLRDEITARHLAVWVDQSPADYEITIKILAFTSREWMRDEYDVAVLFDNTLSIEAIVYDGATNKEIWRSGSISYSDRSDEPGAKAGAESIIQQVSQRLADRLRNTF